MSMRSVATFYALAYLNGRDGQEYKEMAEQQLRDAYADGVDYPDCIIQTHVVLDH